MVGSTGPGDGDDTPPDPASGELSGAITDDQAWSGEIVLVGEVVIEAGVTVTVAPGTQLTARSGVTLRVNGTLEIAGTAAEPVSMLPTAEALTWAGIVAESGASVSIAYAEGSDVASLLYCHQGAVLCTVDHVDFVGLGQAIVAEDTVLVTYSRIAEVANGGLSVRGAGDLTVRDSYVITSTGDIIVQTGGRLTIEYSEIGDAQGAYDHCNLHIGAGEYVSITHTNIINGVYGMMIGGTSGAIFTDNNWMGNDFDISEVGVNTAVDLTSSYWENGAPELGAAFDTSGALTTAVTDAGPRM